MKKPALAYINSIFTHRMKKTPRVPSIAYIIVIKGPKVLVSRRSSTIRKMKKALISAINILNENCLSVRYFSISKKNI